MAAIYPGTISFMEQCVVEARLDDIHRLLDRHPQLVNRRNGIEVAGSWLHYAAMLKRTNVVELLLQRSFPVNATNKNGKMALHMAVESADVPTVEVLLKAGADPEVQCDARNALRQAAVKQWSGADLCWAILSFSRPKLLESTGDGQTALYLAAKHGCHQAAKVLLEAGADIGVVCEDQTVLQAAEASGNQAMLELLTGWIHAHRARQAIDDMGSLAHTGHPGVRPLFL